MAELRQWARINAGPFRFNPLAKLPAILVKEHGTTGPVYLVRPDFGRRYFETEGEAERFLGSH